MVSLPGSTVGSGDGPWILSPRWPSGNMWTSQTADWRTYHKHHPPPDWCLNLLNQNSLQISPVLCSKETSLREKGSSQKGNGTSHRWLINRTVVFTCPDPVWNSRKRPGRNQKSILPPSSTACLSSLLPKWIYVISIKTRPVSSGNIHTDSRILLEWLSGVLGDGTSTCPRVVFL